MPVSSCSVPSLKNLRTFFLSVVRFSSEGPSSSSSESYTSAFPLLGHTRTSQSIPSSLIFVPYCKQLNKSSSFRIFRDFCHIKSPLYCNLIYVFSLTYVQRPHVTYLGIFMFILYFSPSFSSLLIPYYIHYRYLKQCCRSKFIQFGIRAQHVAYKSNTASLYVNMFHDSLQHFDDNKKAMCGSKVLVPIFGRVLQGCQFCCCWLYELI